MPKILIRIVALLLAVCLISDPSLAAIPIVQKVPCVPSPAVSVITRETLAPRSTQEPPAMGRHARVLTMAQEVSAHAHRLSRAGVVRARLVISLAFLFTIFSYGAWKLWDRYASIPTLSEVFQLKDVDTSPSATARAFDAMIADGEKISTDAFLDVIESPKEAESARLSKPAEPVTFVPSADDTETQDIRGGYYLMSVQGMIPRRSLRLQSHVTGVAVERYIGLLIILDPKTRDPHAYIQTDAGPSIDPVLGPFHFLDLKRVAALSGPQAAIAKTLLKKVREISVPQYSSRLEDAPKLHYRVLYPLISDQESRHRAIDFFETNPIVHPLLRYLIWAHHPIQASMIVVDSTSQGRPNFYSKGAVWSEYRRMPVNVMAHENMHALVDDLQRLAENNRFARRLELAMERQWNAQHPIYGALQRDPTYQRLYSYEPKDIAKGPLTEAVAYTFGSLATEHGTISALNYTSVTTADLAFLSRIGFIPRENPKTIGSYYLALLSQEMATDGRTAAEAEVSSMIEEAPNQDVLTMGEALQRLQPSLAQRTIDVYLMNPKRFGISPYENLRDIYAIPAEARSLGSALRLYRLAFAVGTPAQRAAVEKAVSGELHEKYSSVLYGGLQFLMEQTTLTTADESTIAQFLQSHLSKEQLRSLRSAVDSLKQKGRSPRSSDTEMLRLLEQILSPRERGELHSPPQLRLLPAA